MATTGTCRVVWLYLGPTGPTVADLKAMMQAAIREHREPREWDSNDYRKPVTAPRTIAPAIVAAFARLAWFPQLSHRRARPRVIRWRNA